MSAPRRRRPSTSCACTSGATRCSCPTRGMSARRRSWPDWVSGAGHDEQRPRGDARPARRRGHPRRGPGARRRAVAPPSTCRCRLISRTGSPTTPTAWPRRSAWQAARPAWRAARSRTTPAAPRTRSTSRGLARERIRRRRRDRSLGAGQDGAHGPCREPHSRPRGPAATRSRAFRPTRRPARTCCSRPAWPRARTSDASSNPSTGRSTCWRCRDAERAANWPRSGSRASRSVARSRSRRWRAVRGRRGVARPGHLRLSRTVEGRRPRSSGRVRPVSPVTRRLAGRPRRCGGRSTGSGPGTCGASTSARGERGRQRPAQPALALEPHGHRLEHRVGHRAEIAQRLVGVLAHVEVDLGDRVEPGRR